MGQTANRSRDNHTITVDLQDETTSVPLLGTGKAFVELGLAFILSWGFQLKPRTTWDGGGWLTRHAPSVRVRLGGIPLWRGQGTRCQAGFTGLPPFVLRYRQRRPAGARNALLATPGGLSVALWAVISPSSPRALYPLVWALGQQSLVSVLTRCGLPLP